MPGLWGDLPSRDPGEMEGVVSEGPFADLGRAVLNALEPILVPILKAATWLVVRLDRGIQRFGKWRRERS